MVILSGFRARSSVAEQAAHNRLVEGSNPSGPIFHLNYLFKGPRKGDAIGIIKVI